MPYPAQGALTVGIVRPVAAESLFGTACDRCPAAAMVLLVRATGRARKGAVLTLCGHHYAVHEPVLLATGWAVKADDRAKLLIR